MDFPAPRVRRRHYSRTPHRQRQPGRDECRPRGRRSAHRSASGPGDRPHRAVQVDASCHERCRAPGSGRPRLPLPHALATTTSVCARRKVWVRWPAPSMGTIASALLWITSVASCSPHWSGLVRAAEALSVVGHDAIASGLKHRPLRLMAGRQPATRAAGRRTPNATLRRSVLRTSRPASRPSPSPTPPRSRGGGGRCSRSPGAAPGQRRVGCRLG